MLQIHPCVHTGMFQDSILITDWNQGCIDFRCYPDGCIKPYCWSGELEKIFVHNIGGTIDFIGTKETYICISGEITEISKESCV